MLDPFGFDNPIVAPFEFVPVEANGEFCLSEPWHQRVVIQTLHDGEVLPRRFRFNDTGRPLVDRELLEHRFVEERDWGANLVAHKIASALGLPGYGRCRFARVLLDFNRFPGSTPPSNRDHMHRLAIIPPFSEALDHESKMAVLAHFYDGTSEILERRFLADKLILLTVHTYDERNPSFTRRPDLSLISVPQSYHQEARLPDNLFDPLFPDELIESTCCRILRDRISLNLERSGFRVSHNHPYAATDGSYEVRAQVWHFFRHLRQRFEELYPNSREKQAFHGVWRMLLNTNLRDLEAESLRGYLHRYRKIPEGKKRRFFRARDAYVQIRRFLSNRDPAVDFDFLKNRPSSLGLEVRKDLLCEIDPQNDRPVRRSAGQEDLATLIGRVVAGAIKMYIETDRSAYPASVSIP